VSNVSVAIDFQVNLNTSDNASHAALLLNTSGLPVLPSPRGRVGERMCGRTGRQAGMQADRQKQMAISRVQGSG